MFLKGRISSIDSKGARVIFMDVDNIVSVPLKIAAHVNELKINDNVVALFFSENMCDGIIIARW